MLADPIPAPVTCGCDAGAVAPAAMETLAGTVTLLVSLLNRLTVKPPAGAGDDRFSVRFCVALTLMVSGDPEKFIAREFCTKKFRLPIPPLCPTLSVATQSILWIPLDSVVV